MSDAAAKNLRESQTQLDMDGIQVGVSRQALEEVLEEREEARRYQERLEWMVNYEASVDFDAGDTWIVTWTQGVSATFTSNHELRIIADDWPEALDQAIEKSKQLSAESA